jgi:DMSO/TMAO reductase YedYZ molybdopterin-dependent catalytic subunit
VRVRDVLERAEVTPEVTTLVAHAESGYTANVPLADVLRDDALLAWGFDGSDLAPEHGGPLRLVVPSLYFWKSAKWLRGLELVDHDEPGFWERNGYHNDADPWREQRYWGD